MCILSTRQGEEATRPLGPLGVRAPKLINGDGCRRCNCKRSKCLQLYCECFAAKQFCTGCSCIDCHNRDVNALEVGGLPPLPRV